MQYILRVIGLNCGFKRYASYYQIPHKTNPAMAFSDEKYGAWIPPDNKPIYGVDLNTAYKRMEYISAVHKECKCEFEIVEADIK